MHARAVALLGCLLACNTPKPETDAKVEEAKPSAPTKTEPVAEPPVPVPEMKAPPSSIDELARAAGFQEGSSITKPEQFGPNGIVAIVRTRNGAKFELHALLLTLPDLERPTWVLSSSLKLFGWSRDWYDEGDPEAGELPTTIKVDDYDDDGELELSVGISDEIMCSGGGENYVSTFMLVELAETPPRIALQIETDHALGNGAVQTETRILHEDLDADGHRDLKIVYRTKEQGEPDIEDELRWRWDSKTDGWLPLESDGTWKKHTAGQGCDW